MIHYHSFTTHSGVCRVGHTDEEGVFWEVVSRKGGDEDWAKDQIARLHREDRSAERNPEFQKAECNDCGGTGRIMDSSHCCMTCAGDGWVA